jgi:hypothetical protein
MGSPFYETGSQMRTLQEYKRDLSIVLIDTIGGESLDRSGFETEEPSPGFSTAELGGKE